MPKSSLFKSIFWVERMGVILLESELTNELGSLKLLSCKGKMSMLGYQKSSPKAFCIKESKSSVSCMSKNESIFESSLSLLEDTFPLFHIPLHLLVSQKQRSLLKLILFILASVADNSIDNPWHFQLYNNKNNNNNNKIYLYGLKIVKHN